MRKVRTALLVAAATLAGVPAIAVAQDQPRQHGDFRGGGGGRPEGSGRGDRGGDRGQAPQPQAQPAPQTQPQAQVQPQPNPGANNFQRGPGFQGGRQSAGRDGRFDGQQDRRGFDGRGSDNRGFDRRGPDGRGPEGRGFDNNAGRPGNFGPNAHGGQGGYAGRGPDWDRGRGSDRGFDSRDGRPGYNQGGWDRGGPGVQGWRNDRRYDWRGYRDQNRQLFRAPRYQPPRGYRYGYRLFTPGLRLDPFFFDRSYWIDDPYDYRLPPAYGPYRWVHYYNDVLLVDIRTGTVVDVIRDFFW